MIDTVVILAAGRGTRLGEVTKNRSKAMCPVVGQPMLGRVMATFKDSGVNRFIVVAMPNDEELIDHCSQVQGVTVVYQDSPQGSAKALQTCTSVVSGMFYVTACDSIVSAPHILQLGMDVQSAGAEGGIGIMEVSPTESLEARSVVEMVNGRVQSIIEKPSPAQRISNITSIPLYVLSDQVFGVLANLAPSSRGEYELPQALNALVRAGRQFVGTMIDERQELTNREDLLQLSGYYLAKMPQSIEIDATAEVDRSAVVQSPVFIGPRCKIAAGAHVGPYVSMEADSQILPGCEVGYSVLLQGSVVTDDVQQEVVI